MKFSCPQGDFNAETAGTCPNHKVALQETKTETVKVDAVKAETAVKTA
jgi:hypothetical protein